MPGTRCSISVCGNTHPRTKKSGEAISYHAVPKCDSRKRAWCESLGVNLRSGDRVCSKHFTADCYEEFLPGQKNRVLKRSALPKPITAVPEGNASFEQVCCYTYFLEISDPPSIHIISHIQTIMPPCTHTTPKLSSKWLKNMQ